MYEGAYMFDGQEPDACNIGQPNPSDYPGEVCDKCGSRIFVAGAALKTIPGLVLGMGSDPISVPVFKTFVCARCGEVIASDRAVWETVKASLEKEDEKLKGAEGPKTSIII